MHLESHSIAPRRTGVDMGTDTLSIKVFGCLLGVLLMGILGLFGQESARIEVVAGTGVAGYSGDGGAAREAQLNNPFGVVRGPDGALYVCDTGNHCIRRIDSEGVITTVAGTGQAGYSGDRGSALQARLHEPYEIRFDAEGHMVFVEMRNHVVRRVDRESGRIETMAGTGESGFSGDGGPATRARLNRPHSIQFGPDGRLYICDIGNHRIRRVDPGSGLIETYAGTGNRSPAPDRGPLAGADLNGPRAIDFDAEGRLWLALREGNQVLRIHPLDPAEAVMVRIAGTGAKGFTGHGGPALDATLSGPKGLSVGPDGNVYLADTESHSLRMINVETRTLELLAGDGQRGDGPSGDPLQCRMARLHGVFADADGSVYIGDSETHRVRRWFKE